MGEKTFAADPTAIEIGHSTHIRTIDPLNFLGFLLFPGQIKSDLRRKDFSPLFAKTRMGLHPERGISGWH